MRYSVAPGRAWDEFQDMVYPLEEYNHAAIYCDFVIPMYQEEESRLRGLGGTGQWLILSIPFNESRRPKQ